MITYFLQSNDTTERICIKLLEKAALLNRRQIFLQGAFACSCMLNVLKRKSVKLTTIREQLE